MYGCMQIALVIGLLMLAGSLAQPRGGGGQRGDKDRAFCDLTMTSEDGEELTRVRNCTADGATCNTAAAAFEKERRCGGHITGYLCTAYDEKPVGFCQMDAECQHDGADPDKPQPTCDTAGDSFTFAVAGDEGTYYLCKRPDRPEEEEEEDIEGEEDVDDFCGRNRCAGGDGPRHGDERGARSGSRGGGMGGGRPDDRSGRRTGEMGDGRPDDRSGDDMSDASNGERSGGIGGNRGGGRGGDIGGGNRRGGRGGGGHGGRGGDRRG